MTTKTVKVIQPVFSDELVRSEETESVLGAAANADERVQGMEFLNGVSEEKNYVNLVVSGTKFVNCRFWECSFEKAEFVDVVFQSCDFSGCNMENAYFNRVEFVTCKGVGTKFAGSILKHTFINECNFNYANFDAARIENMKVQNTEMNGSNVTQCKCKAVGWHKAGLANASFFKTSMRGMDFRDSVIDGIVLSDDCRELKGAIVDLYQAAELAKRMGLVVK